MKIIHQIILILILSTSVMIMAAEPIHNTSFSERLSTIQDKNKEGFYGKISGLPKFDAQLHSDGCSGGMSAGYAKINFLHAYYGLQLPWHDCCVKHDEAYYYGGTKEDKRLADKNLKECVSHTLDGQQMGLLLGNLMEKGVWLGGLPYLPTSFRWGYGEDFRLLPK